MKVEEKVAQVIIGYVPLMYPGDIRLDMEYFANDIANVPEISIIGCAWTINEKKENSPIFVIDRAQEVLDHMKFWAEDKPEKWFKVHWTRKGDKYAIALVPEPQMMADRFRVNFQLQNGFPFPKGRKTQIFYRFLSFTASRSGVELGKEVDMYFLDKKHTENIEQKALSESLLVGRFKVVRDSDTAKSILKGG